MNTIESSPSSSFSSTRSYSEPRVRVRRGRTRLPLIAAACLSTLVLVACGKKDETAAATATASPASAKNEAPRPVRVIAAGASDVTDAIFLPGEVRSRFEQRYGFRVPGKIAQRLVDVGQEVKAGQVLAVLDSQDVMPQINAQAAQVDVARTDLNFQRSELKRQQELRDKGFVSGAALERQAAATESASARLKAAQSQLATAQNGLNFQTLRADKAGVVVGVDAEAGSVVAAGQSVVRVAQLGEREILVNAPERAVAQMKTASGFLVAFDALPGKYVRAKLRELSPAADPASRTYAARLTLLESNDAVKLGMSATVRSELSAAKAIVIPNSALYTRDSATRVWLLDRASETVKPVEIKLGASTNDGVTVASGLNVGDLVVTAGANLLQPGQKVRLIETASVPSEKSGSTPVIAADTEKKASETKAAVIATKPPTKGADKEKAQ